MPENSGFGYNPYGEDSNEDSLHRDPRFQNPAHRQDYGDGAYRNSWDHRGAHTSFSAGYGAFTDDMIGEGVRQPGGEIPPQFPVFVAPPHRPQLGRTLSTAISLVNRDFVVWFGFGALAVIVSAVSSAPSFITGLQDSTGSQNAGLPDISPYLGSSMGSFLSGIVGMLIGIVAIRGALEAIDGRKVTFRSFFAIRTWGSQLGVAIIATLIGLLILVPTYVLVGIAVFKFLALAGKSSPSSAEIGSAVGLSLLAVVLAIFVSLLWAPMQMMMQHLVMDGRSGAIASIRNSWNYLKPHFWPMVGLSFVVGIIGAAGMLFFFVGLFYTIPLSSIMSAIMYRQLVGGRQPQAM